MAVSISSNQPVLQYNNAWATWILPLQVVALPISGFSFSLFYRIDTFRSNNWTLPVTWKGLIRMAGQINGAFSLLHKQTTNRQQTKETLKAQGKPKYQTESYRSVASHIVAYYSQHCIQSHSQSEWFQHAVSAYFHINKQPVHLPPCSQAPATCGDSAACGVRVAVWLQTCSGKYPHVHRLRITRI